MLAHKTTNVRYELAAHDNYASEINAAWHTFRRTYATYMRRYAGLDDKDLVDTHRWRGIESASRYAQTVVREAARKADLLPTPPKDFESKPVENGKN